jgi:HEAT repeat protein
MKWAPLLLVLSVLAMSAAAYEVDELILRLKDPNNEVRFQAAAALGNIGDPRAVDSLI